MAIKINNLVLDIEEDISNLKKKACNKLNLSEKNIKEFKIIKESIDARRKNNIKFTYSVEINCENESKIVAKAKDKDVKIIETKYDEEFNYGNKKMESRPVVIGMGPAGLFAGLLLAKNGYKPLIFERGEDVDNRTKSVNKFWETGELNLESNVQFGEGGAGTFSDGKLTTRIKDSRCDFVLEQFVASGAPEEIIYSGKPHIGTDILKGVVKNIREKIISYGGEVIFNSKLENIIVKDKKICGVAINGQRIYCESLILAIGHSSRDTYDMLYKNGVFMRAKPFAIGVRVEHLQSMINKVQYGNYFNHPRLKAADYRLTYTCPKSKRAVYSFCMCPGGYVVAAASESKRLVTNGMSFYDRNGLNSNAAIVVSVGPEDFEGNDPLSGIRFQSHYESLTYNLTDGYFAPVQLLGDFLEDKNSNKIGSVKPTYKPGYEFRELKKCLPNYVTESLKEGFISFDKRIKGFASKDTVLTGIETRTSAPVRVERNEKLESISYEGLYPAGEGAGFAGGIISAAVDGLKVAESIMKQYLPLY